MNNIKTAPIVLFVYNRPEHTEKTLYALKNNTLAAESKLFIYSDGPKNPDNIELIENVKQVREVIKKEKWCGDVQIFKSDNNKGLANSIRFGVTDIISKYGEIIVLEDDLVTSPAFLTYMNKALCFYQNYKSVFSISGYCLPSKKFSVPIDYKYDVFAGLRNSSWGWATWSDRWNQVDWDLKAYNTIKKNEAIKHAFNRGGDDVFELLDMQQTGKLNIWSIQFTVAHFVNHGVSIIPTKSYVDNIGHDGSGENCYVRSGLQHNSLNQDEEIKFLDILYQDKQIINAYYNAYCRKRRPIWKKIINRISRILGGKNIFILKKKIYC
jgi:hypothetical protein